MTICTYSAITQSYSAVKSSKEIVLLPLPSANKIAQKGNESKKGEENDQIKH